MLDAVHGKRSALRKKARQVQLKSQDRDEYKKDDPDPYKQHATFFGIIHAGDCGGQIAKLTKGRATLEAGAETISPFQGIYHPQHGVTFRAISTVLEGQSARARRQCALIGADGELLRKIHLAEQKKAA